MRVDLFDFDLPEELIALRPADPRDSSRLLEVRPDGEPRLSDHIFRDLPSLLLPGDLLVFNDTKVIPAQLTGTRRRGENAARVPFTLHMRVDGKTWKAFARGAKRLREGDTVTFGNADQLSAKVSKIEEGGSVTLVFDKTSADLDAAIAEFGSVPLPPYISSKRPHDERDRQDYQTVYARHDGAVAAPTAGLHFTPGLLSRLDHAGIETCHVTLHVGAGTFLPVKAEDTDAHKMHEEVGHVSARAAEKINECRFRGGRVISVGTTSLRLLESAAGEDGTMTPWSGPTDIFITPGYRFRCIDGLVTNFHLPKSTLFMLVAALSGLEAMKEAYRHAIARNYRFYSYGDGSLLWRAEPG